MSQIIKSFNNRTIRVREEDQYFSLTDMAQATNKKVHDWTRLESAKSYLVALSTSTGIPVDHLVNTKLDGANEDRGTWAHRKVAIRFAQWCSDEFAVQVDTWIEELMTKGSVNLVLDKPKSPAEMLVLYAEQFLLQEQRLAQIEAEQTVIKEAQEELDNRIDYTERTLREMEDVDSEVLDRLEIVEAEQDRFNNPNGHKLSILGFATLQGLTISAAEASRLGRKASRKCRERGITIEYIRDPRFGQVGIYPEVILIEVFGE